jgi:hypothetical protein
LAFVAAARLAFVVLREPESERSLLLPVKNNLGPKAEGLGYTIEPAYTRPGGIETSKVVWDREPVTMTADEAVRGDTRRGHALRDAIDFLNDQLEGGPMKATKIMEAAHAAGISEDAVRRAQKQMKIIPEKNGFQGAWMWSLP